MKQRSLICACFTVWCTSAITSGATSNAKSGSQGDDDFTSGATKSGPQGDDGSDFAQAQAEIVSAFMSAVVIGQAFFTGITVHFFSDKPDMKFYAKLTLKGKPVILTDIDSVAQVFDMALPMPNQKPTHYISDIKLELDGSMETVAAAFYKKILYQLSTTAWVREAAAKDECLRSQNLCFSPKDRESFEASECFKVITRLEKDTTGVSNTALVNPHVKPPHSTRPEGIVVVLLLSETAKMVIELHYENKEKFDSLFDAWKFLFKSRSARLSVLKIINGVEHTSNLEIFEPCRKFLYDDFTFNLEYNSKLLPTSSNSKSRLSRLFSKHSSLSQSKPSNLQPKSSKFMVTWKSFSDVKRSVELIIKGK